MLRKKKPECFSDAFSVQVQIGNLEAEVRRTEVSNQFRRNDSTDFDRNSRPAEPPHRSRGEKGPLDFGPLELQKGQRAKGKCCRKLQNSPHVYHLRAKISPVSAEILQDLTERLVTQIMSRRPRWQCYNWLSSDPAQIE